MSHTDTATSRSPRLSDIDELPGSKCAASALWVHNKLWLHHVSSPLPPPLPPSLPLSAGRWSDWAVSNKPLNLSQHVSRLSDLELELEKEMKRAKKITALSGVLLTSDKTGLRCVCGHFCSSLESLMIFLQRLVPPFVFVRRNPQSSVK